MFILKKSTKALLLSALVFPGAGHFLLKKYKTGFVLLAILSCASYFVISLMMTKAFELSDQITSGAVALDPVELSAMLSSQTTAGDAQTMSLATTACMVVWVFGLIDC